MNADDTSIVVGEPMPSLAVLRYVDGHRVAVTWAEGPRAGLTETVDLGPALRRYRVYTPLRTDLALFATVEIVGDGTALAWNDGRLDMSAVMVEHLARVAAAAQMSADQFRAWMERNRLTYDAAADTLGIARRLVAYYVSGDKPVPRTVALACAGYDTITHQAA